MIKKKLFTLQFLVFLCIAVSTQKGNAQSYIVTDKAKLAQLKAAVKAKPEDFDTHFAYIRAMGFDSPELIKQYEVWTKEYPKSVMFPYAMGEFLTRRANSKAREFLLKAVAVDSNYAAAWSALSSDAELRGDTEGAIAYLGKAAAAAPDNADYAFQYAYAFSGADMEKYTKMSLAFVARFHEHRRAPQALFWLAHFTTDIKEKIAYYERMRKEFPAASFDWTVSGMADYFDLLLVSDSDKAVALAEELAAVKQLEKQWSALLLTARKVNEAKKLMDEKKGGAALEVLNTITLGKYSSIKKDLLLWKAQANDIAGHTDVAYDSLLRAFVKAPALKIKKQLVFYGNKIGKNNAAIEADIRTQLDAVTEPATTFSLKNYFTNANTSLEDYKGKVVLLTYWYPGCGPCRGEFPYFENVARKFKGQDFDYIGINIYPKQSDYVIPFVKGSGYSFTPLEDVKDRVKGNLDNGGVAPINFLIDKEGRLVFSNFRTDSNNEDELELMIRMLLEGKKG